MPHAVVGVSLVRNSQSDLDSRLKPLLAQGISALVQSLFDFHNPIVRM